MMGFLDAENLLSDLRSGELTLTDKIYYISFDNKTTSQDDLSELKSRCIRLGYSFNYVEICQSPTNDLPIFFYLVKILPDSITRLSKEYAMVEKVMS
jgi:hypothetical protein